MKNCKHFVLEDALIDSTEFCSVDPYMGHCKEIHDCYYKQLQHWLIREKDRELKNSEPVETTCADYESAFKLKRRKALFKEYLNNKTLLWTIIGTIFIILNFLVSNVLGILNYVK